MTENNQDPPTEPKIDVGDIAQQIIDEENAKDIIFNYEYSDDNTLLKFTPTPKQLNREKTIVNRKGDLVEVQKTQLERAFIDGFATGQYLSDDQHNVWHVTINPHVHLTRVGGTDYDNKLRSIFVDNNDGELLKQQALTDATNNIISAVLNANLNPVKLHLRVCDTTDRLIIDLTDQNGTYVDIKAGTWTLTTQPNKYFRTETHQLPLPTPDDTATTNDIRLLDHYLPPSIDPEGKLLFYCWLIASYFDIPRSALIFTGPQGSAKSVFSKLAKSLVDPSSMPLIRVPDDEDNFAVLCDKHWLVCFDNITHTEKFFNDALCRAVTGASFTKRKLYTDDQTIQIHLKKAFSINGINLWSTAPDVLDRCILQQLERIDENARKSEDELLLSFEKDKSKIFGAICTILAKTIELRKSIVLPKKPRMADFAITCEAASRVMGNPENAFLTIYNKTMKEHATDALESIPIGQPLITLLEENCPLHTATKDWEVTPDELLDRLREVMLRNKSDGKLPWGWPNTPMIMGKQIMNLKATLMDIGWDANRKKITHGKRIYCFRNIVCKIDNTKYSLNDKVAAESVAATSCHLSCHPINGAVEEPDGRNEQKVAAEAGNPQTLDYTVFRRDKNNQSVKLLEHAVSAATQQSVPSTERVAGEVLSSENGEPEKSLGTTTKEINSGIIPYTGAQDSGIISDDSAQKSDRHHDKIYSTTPILQTTQRKSEVGNSMTQNGECKIDDMTPTSQQSQSDRDNATSNSGTIPSNTKVEEHIPLHRARQDIIEVVGKSPGIPEMAVLWLFSDHDHDAAALVIARLKSEGVLFEPTPGTLRLLK